MHLTLPDGTRLAMPRSTTVAPVTIATAFARFLDAEQACVSAAAYRKTERAIGDFEACLDGHGHMGLDAGERQRFNLFFNAKETAHREFCEVFGPEHVLANIEEFLGRYMISKVMCGRAALESAGPAVARLVKWLAAKGLVDRVDAELALAQCAVAGRALPVAVEVGERLHELADEAADKPCDAVVEDAFVVSMIRPREIFVDAEMSGEEYGPISIPEDVAAKLEIGWRFWASLGRFEKAWNLREVGFVYPERS